MKYQATPNDSRYVPFNQQKYDCVPTSISMIMYRRGIPLVPTEELGYHLGLVVPPKDKSLYYAPRVSDTPPSAAGYGTQIYNPNFEIGKVLKKLGIPLAVELILADKIKSPEDLVDKLSDIEKHDDDACLCFNYKLAHGKPDGDGGHVVVFDRIVDGKIRVIDAWYENAKWQLMEPDLLYRAIQKHGSDKSGGIWRFTKNV
jgi:hypothetical protein